MAHRLVFGVSCDKPPAVYCLMAWQEFYCVANKLRSLRLVIKGSNKHQVSKTTRIRFMRRVSKRINPETVLRVVIMNTVIAVYFQIQF